MRRAFASIAGLLCVLALAPGCVSVDAPPEVGRGIAFGVTPFYPNRFEIVATGTLRRSGDTLRDAWRKKAEQVAAGRNFHASSLTERVSEGIAGGWPLRTRSITGTTTVADHGMMTGPGRSP